MSEIRDGEDGWQWPRLEIRQNTFCQSTIPQKQFNSSMPDITAYYIGYIGYLPTVIFKFLRSYDIYTSSTF